MEQALDKRHANMVMNYLFTNMMENTYTFDLRGSNPYYRFSTDDPAIIPPEYQGNLAWRVDTATGHTPTPFEEDQLCKAMAKFDVHRRPVRYNEKLQKTQRGREGRFTQSFGDPKDERVWLLFHPIEIPQIEQKLREKGLMPDFSQPPADYDHQTILHGMWQVQKYLTQEILKMPTIARQYRHDFSEIMQNAYISIESKNAEDKRERNVCIGFPNYSFYQWQREGITLLHIAHNLLGVMPRMGVGHDQEGKAFPALVFDTRDLKGMETALDKNHQLSKAERLELVAAQLRAESEQKTKSIGERLGLNIPERQEAELLR